MSQEQITQIVAAIGAFCALCGALSNVLPQKWKFTKLLTKVGSFSMRAKTDTSWL
jgi:hypothetical protein